MAESKDDSKESQINIGVDPNRTPILYADAIIIISSDNGIVLDVTQKIGPTNQAHIVARIGLSKEHAKKLGNKLLEQIQLIEGSTVTGKIKIIN